MEGFDSDRPITYADFRAMTGIVELRIHIRVAMTCATMIFSWWVICGS